jgi:hypothetical protein
MTDGDNERVRAARERALAQAGEFFESLTPEQLASMQASAGEAASAEVEAEEMAAVFEQNGLMSKADYLEMNRILTAFRAGTPTAEDDFESMLRLLRDSQEAIARAKVLAFLGELVKREAAPSRLARVEEAIAPWREGPEDLDILYWAFVRQALDEVSDRLHEGN